MFFLKRLLGREDILDDAETEYVESRASASEIERLRERLTASPERLADLDSIRSTVNLLRSVQSEMAPRSFALAEAPAFARSRSRAAAFAPAMAAIVAAIGVGLLAIGDLTGIVSQSESGSGQDSTALFSTEGPEGPAGPAGVAGGSEGDSGAESALAPSAMVTPTIPAESLVPDSGYGITQDQLDRLAATVETGAGQELAIGEGAASDATEPNPETSAAVADDSTAKLVGDGDEGISLPLWQLQVSLAGLAALMVAAWAFIRRRATA